MRRSVAFLAVCSILAACHVDPDLKTPRFPDWPYWKDWADGYVTPDINRPPFPQLTIIVVDDMANSSTFQNDVTVQYLHPTTINVTVQADCVGGVHDLSVLINGGNEFTMWGDQNRNLQLKVPITLKYALPEHFLGPALTVTASARNYRLEESDLTVVFLPTASPSGQLPKASTGK